VTRGTPDATEILREIAAMRRSFEARFDRIEERLARLSDDAVGPVGDVQTFLTGEAVLGRYAVSQIEKRLTAIEARLAALEVRA
jgi:hypothetical protein